MREIASDRPQVAVPYGRGEDPWQGARRALGYEGAAAQRRRFCRLDVEDYPTHVRGLRRDAGRR